MVEVVTGRSSAGSSGPVPEAVWRSYDGVAETYQEAAVPWFSELARDLVDKMCMSAPRAVLDLGCGTGLAARYSRLRLGTGSWIVGLDPSMVMLGLIESTLSVTPVRAVAPDLPFRVGAFDAIIMNLSLSHVSDLPATLEAVSRVLATGGRFGFTAWAPASPASETNRRPDAEGMVAEIVRDAGLDIAPTTSAVPYEETLRSPRATAEHLTAAGFDVIAIDEAAYRFDFAIDMLLSGWGSLARYQREVAGAATWNAVMETAARRIRQELGEPIPSTDNFWIVTATRG